MGRSNAVRARIEEAPLVIEGRFACERCGNTVRKLTLKCPGCGLRNGLVAVKGPIEEFSADMVDVVPCVCMECGRQPPNGLARGLVAITSCPRCKQENCLKVLEKDDEEEGDDGDDGEGPIVHTVGHAKVRKVPRVSYGINGFDHIMCPKSMWKGKKAEGQPLGSLVGLTGGPGSGKTTILRQAAVHAAASGLVVVMIDGEESHVANDIEMIKYAKSLGLNTKRGGDLDTLHVIDSCEFIEQGLDRAEEYDADVLMVNSLQEFRALDVTGEPMESREGDPSCMRRVVRKTLNFVQGKNEMRKQVCGFIVLQVRSDGEMDGVGNKALHKVDQCYKMERDPDYDVVGAKGYRRIWQRAVKGKTRGADDALCATYRRINTGPMEGLLECLGITKPDA